MKTQFGLIVLGMVIVLAITFPTSAQFNNGTPSTKALLQAPLDTNNNCYTCDLLIRLEGLILKIVIGMNGSDE